MSESITITIDGNLHIKKLAERYLPQKELHLLEWIRFARIRQASRITLTLQADQTTLIDNGQAISPEQWHALHTLLDSKSAPDIEKSIELLKPPRGLGILAPWASGSHRFTIMSPENGSMKALTRGAPFAAKTLNLISGHVALVLGPRPGNRALERELLQKYLPLVNAHIILDNQVIIPRQQTADAFLSLKIYQQDQIVGSVSLPKIDNRSTLLLCHGDIPWRILHFPPKQGQIFWARVETVAAEDDLLSLNLQISQTNTRLLEYLRDHPAVWPATLKERIEELLFEWARHQPDCQPIIDLPLFLMGGQIHLLSLRELQERAQNAPLTAIISEKNSTANPSGILLLNRKQADFLSRSAQIPLTFVGIPLTASTFLEPLKKFFLGLLYSLDRWLALLLGKKIKEKNLSSPERALIDHLGVKLRHIGQVKPNFIASAGLRISLIRYKGLWPAHVWARRNHISVHSRHIITMALIKSLTNAQSTALLEKAIIPPEMS